MWLQCFWKNSKRFRTWLGTLCLISAGVTAHTYNLNTATGLPSNHIYNATADHLGYLWLTSPAGVVRYNGYEARLFGSNEGLPCEDIWYLLEDRSARIWLSSISDETGYIKNGRYYPAIQDSGHFFHPFRLKRDKDGILMLFNPKGNSARRWTYCTYTGNVMRHRSWDAQGIYRMLINDSLQLLAIMNDKRICKLAFRGSQLILKPRYTLEVDSLPSELDLFGNHICYYYNNQDRFYVSDGPGKTYCIRPFSDSSERIVMAYSHEGLLYLYSHQSVSVYDEAFHLQERFRFSDFTGREKQQDQQQYIYRRLPLWGSTLCSADKGVYVAMDKRSPFRWRTDLDLEGYQQAGSWNSNAGKSYWWNAKSGKLKALQGLRQSGAWDLNRMKAGDNYRQLQPTGITSPQQPFSISQAQAQLTVTEEGKSYLSNAFKAAVRMNRDTFFLIASHMLHRYGNGAHTALMHTFCTAMSYDQKRNGLWLYSEQQLSFYDISANTVRNIEPAALRRLGLRKITALLVDTLYGNIFIKDNEHLYLLDENLAGVTPVYPKYRYKNATIMLHGNHLAIAGRFGVLYAAIKAKGRLADDALVYENPGDVFYRSVNGFHIADSGALLLTDKGTYEVSLTPAAVMPEDRFRIIAATPDTAWQLNTGDTLQLRPGARYLSLDLIRPGGVGQVRYEYRLDTSRLWQPLPGKEWNLEGLDGGAWHRVYVRVNDEVWQSPAMLLLVSIQPWWWQSPLFTTSALLVLLGLCVIIAVITRKLVLRQQLRQKLLLEMNLNAVHAQLNPHFIFNSLTTTQYLVKAGKTQEATRHISRFSRLLRSFLKASRDKYISVAEEISHLENYIQLEQERFSEPFSYQIQVDPDINTSQKIPSLLLQPLVENAIQHGLLHKESKGDLLIAFESVTDGMRIRIADNGIGREQAKYHRETSKESYGKELLSRLVQLFNTYESVKLDIRYIDKVPPQSGTVVIIHIKDTRS